MSRVLLFTLFLCLPIAVLAQARESADTTRHSLEVGAAFSMYNPDVYCTDNSPFTCGGVAPLLKGFGVFADYNIGPRWGAEGEARWLHWDSAGGQVESNYLIGPRYSVFRWRRFEFWAKFMMGIGGITTEGYPGPDTLKGTMFVYAPGASVSYRLNRRFALRGDYELQKWPEFALQPPHNHGITPNGFSLGLAYAILQ